MDKMTNEQIAELIKRRRLQLLVHSCIYYEYNQSLITDAQWAEWAVELERLQTDYPAIAAKVEWAVEFAGFDHSTGYNLPTRDPWVMRKAIQVMRWDKARRTDNYDKRQRESS